MLLDSLSAAMPYRREQPFGMRMQVACLAGKQPPAESEPIIGSLEREEAKEMGLLPNRTRRAEVAFFLRLALMDLDVRM